MTEQQSIKALTVIPGVGKSIARDLWNIGIKRVSDLSGQDPEELVIEENTLILRYGILNDAHIYSTEGHS